MTWRDLRYLRQWKLGSTKTGEVVILDEPSESGEWLMDFLDDGFAFLADGNDTVVECTKLFKQVVCTAEESGLDELVMLDDGEQLQNLTDWTSQFMTVSSSN